MFFSQCRHMVRPHSPEDRYQSPRSARGRLQCSNVDQKLQILTTRMPHTRLLQDAQQHRRSLVALIQLPTQTRSIVSVSCSECCDATVELTFDLLER